MKSLLHKTTVILLLLALLCLFPSSALVQNNVNVQVFMPSNPSPYFSDWLDGSQNIQVVVQNPVEQTWFVQFSFSLYLDGQQVLTTDLSSTEPVILEPGILMFQLQEILVNPDALVFSDAVEQSILQTGKLPAGMYQVCVQLFEMELQQWLTEPSCQFVTVTDYQPPLAFYPYNGMELMPGQPLYFQFSPVNPPVPPTSSMYPLTYQLVVMEILEEQSPVDAFVSNIPVFEHFAEMQTQIFWTPDFDPPQPGVSYVWNVRAVDAMGNHVGPGEGWGEPSVFVVSGEEPDPLPDDGYAATFIVVTTAGNFIQNAVISLNGEVHPPGQNVFTNLLPGEYIWSVIAEGFHPQEGIIIIDTENVVVEVVLSTAPDDDPPIGEPGLLCSCEPCHVVALSVSSEHGVLTVHRMAPLLAGETYSFTPTIRSTCPAHCASSVQATFTFILVGNDGEILAETQKTGTPEVTFTPRQHGTLRVSVSATITCEDQVCECTPVMVNYPVGATDLADTPPGISVPLDETRPPDDDGTLDPDDEKPEPRKPHDPADPAPDPDPDDRDPPITTHDPEPDPDDDACAPATRTEPGPPIVLNIDLENAGKFPYPRAVPLHAHAIDWDIVFFRCTDCEGAIREEPMAVMDKVSNFTWELQGVGSLNDPFRADKVMELQQSMVLLEDLKSKLQVQIDQLENELATLEEDIEARKKSARERLENLQARELELQDRLQDIENARDGINDEIAAIRQKIEDILTEIEEIENIVGEAETTRDELMELLRNKPGEDEYALMQVIEGLLDERESLRDDIIQKERDILDQKSVFQDQINTLKDELKTVSGEYNEIVARVPGVQASISQLYNQVYSTETVTYVMEQKNPWIEGADQILLFLETEVLIPADSLESLYFYRNEVEKWVPGFFATSSAQQLQNIVDTVLIMVELFSQELQVFCDSIHNEELQLTCYNYAFWLGQVQTPFVQSLNQVVQQEVPVFNPRQLQQLENYQNLLNSYRFQLQQLATDIENKTGQLDNLYNDFYQSMNILEQEKRNLENEFDLRQLQIMARQQELGDLEKARNNHYNENRELWVRQKFSADSLISATQVQIISKEHRIGRLAIDTLDLYFNAGLLGDTIADIESQLSDIDKLKHNLEEILKFDFEELRNKKEAQLNDLTAQLGLVDSQLEDLQRQMEEMIESQTLVASGGMVYYIPPPLEKIMKDPAKFEELKKEVENTRSEYHAAVAFKGSLQERFVPMLEELSRNLQRAKLADQQLEDAENEAQQLGDEFNELHDEKTNQYNALKETLENDEASLRSRMEQAEARANTANDELTTELLQLDSRKSLRDTRQQELLTHQQQLITYSRQLDSLERIASERALTTRELSDQLTRLHSERDALLGQLEQANDQLSIAINTNNESEETHYRNLVNTYTSSLATVRSSIQNTGNELAGQKAALTEIAGLLDEYRNLYLDQQELVSVKREEYSEALEQYNESFQRSQTLSSMILENNRLHDRLGVQLDRILAELNALPPLGEIIGADGELQNANQQKLEAEKRRDYLTDMKGAAMNRIQEILAQKDHLTDSAETRLEKAIAERDRAERELREFLLEELEQVEFEDVLIITAKDDVIDQWRSSDDKVEKQVIIRYEGHRIPELVAEREVAVKPSLNPVGAGQCEVDYDPEEYSPITPQASQVIGPEPRTIALVYENGKPLWEEWPVMPNTGDLIAGSVLRMLAGGYDRDLITHYCDSQDDECDSPDPVEYVFEDVLDFTWQGDGEFFNRQAFSEYVLWEPEETPKPLCDKPQQIRTYYRDSPVAPDDQMETISLIGIKPGIMIEVTDSIMGYPDHEREVRARIVKGDYTGLPGEYIRFTAQLVDGQSEGWGFNGGDDNEMENEITVSTNGAGYGIADFSFGDGFARFTIMATWLREEESGECDTKDFLAEAPLYLQFHYLGYSVEAEIRDAAKELWDGASAGAVISDMDDVDTENGTAAVRMLAVAGILDHNRDFVNASGSEEDEEGEADPGTINYSLSGGAGSGNTSLEMDPEKAFTEVFGIADSYVVPEPEEDMQFSVTATLEDVFVPLGKPATDRKEFTTRRIYEFWIGKDDDLFMVKMDEGISPSEPVNGQGYLFSTSAPGQILLEALGGVELNVQDVILEEGSMGYVAIDGKVSWQADEELSVEMWGFAFGLDSLAIYPIKGAEIGGSINHTHLSYPVSFVATLFTTGEFYGQVYNLPELTIRDFKLRQGTSLVIDWMKEKSPGDLDPGFRGIVIRQATLEFPPIFRSSGTRTPASLSVVDFAIGTGGIHGVLSISGTPLELGYAGFEFAMNDLTLRFKDSEIEDFSMKGTFAFPEPVSGNLAATVNIVGDTGWSIELETGQDINIPKLGTSIAIHTGTSISWEKENELGTAVINGMISSEHFSDIEIVGLEANTEGIVKAEAIHVGIGATLGDGFSFHINTVSFSIGEDEDFLMLDGGLGLSLFAAAQLEGALKVVQGPAVEFIFKSARIEYERTPFSFTGELAYDGNEFRGLFDINIERLFGLEGLLIFGTSPLSEEEFYDYWYAQLVLKGSIPMGYVSLLALGGGLGYNYLPPVGSFEGQPDFNEAFSFKAIIGLGNSGVPPGGIINSRFEMVYYPGLFGLYGKLWLLQQQDALFGEGELKQHWDPERRTDGRVRMYIGLADAEGKIFRFNGEVAFLFTDDGYSISSQDISGHLFEEIQGEMTLSLEGQRVDVQGKIFYKGEGEVDIGVAIIKGMAEFQAQAGFTYNNSDKHLQASAAFDAFASVDLINNFWNVHISVIRQQIKLACSIDANPQRIIFDATAKIDVNVWVVSQTVELNFGYEI